MKSCKKYIKYFCFFAILFLVFSITKVEAATYTYCEYNYPKESKINSVVSKYSVVDSKIKLLYKDNKLWLADIMSTPADDESTEMSGIEVFDDDTQWSAFANKYSTLTKGVCPNNIVADFTGVSWGNGTMLDETDNLTYTKVDKTEKTFSFSEKYCEYKFKSNGDGFNNDDLPGEEVNGKYEVSNLKVKMEVVEYPYRRISYKVYQVLSGNQELLNRDLSLGQDENIGWIYDKNSMTSGLLMGTHADLLLGSNGVLDYSTIDRFMKLYKQYLEGTSCPKYFYYYPDKDDDYDGMFISTISIDPKDSVNVDKGDDKYATYVWDNSNTCNTKVNKAIDKFKTKEGYNDAGKNAIDKFDWAKKLSKEIDESIKSKSLTTAQNEGLLEEINKNTPSGGYLIDESVYNTYIADTKYCSNYNELNENYKNFVDTYKIDATSAIDELTEKLDRAVESSEKMNDEEKKEAKKKTNETKNIVLSKLKFLDEIGLGEDVSCEDIWGTEENPYSLYSMIKDILKMVRIVVPILLIVFGGVDFGKAVLSSDQDALKKAQSNFIKRAIAAIAVFFLPMLVELLLDWFIEVTGYGGESCIIK